jgi:hypothetical protein
MKKTTKKTKTTQSNLDKLIAAGVFSAEIAKKFTAADKKMIEGLHPLEVQALIVMQDSLGADFIKSYFNDPHGGNF